MQGSLFNKIKDIFGKDKEEADVNSSEPATEEKVQPENNDASNSDSGESSSVVQSEAGKEVQDNTTANGTAAPTPETPKHTPEEIKNEVIKVLKTCYDPEIPVDVYELGLIYDVKVATNGDVLIVMTLTSPACPVAGILPNEIEQKVKDHPMVNDCKVELTFDPPWNQRMMSEVAMLELGFL